MTLKLPHFDQYLGIWAMQEEAFLAGWAALQGLDLHVHMASERPAQAAAAAERQRSFNVQEGVAIIPLQGVLMKTVPSMTDGTSTVLARRQLREAMRDDSVDSILLHIDSPGGTVAGNQELVDDIRAAGKRKPTWSYLQDLGASAAFWAGISAHKVFANPTAIVGSIGTYGVAYDLSAKATLQGVKVHVLRAGEMKGAGEPGVELSAGYLAERQKIVNELNEFFVRGVASSRRMTLAKARELADGRVYVGQAAVERGLIDGIQSLDDTFSQLLAASQRRKSRMNANLEPDAALAADLTAQAGTGGANPSPGPAASSTGAGSPTASARPATYHELKAALAGADPAFITSQLDANATVEQARNGWMAKLAADNKALAAKNAELEQQRQAGGTPPTNQGKKPGVPGLVADSAAPPAAAGTGGDPIEAFNEAVREEMTRSKCSRHVAHATVCRQQPELRDAMVAAHNAAHPDARDFRRRGA